MIQKYFQEFSLTQSLVDHIKQLNLANTIAMNMGDEGKYALTISCMDLLNGLEESVKASSDQQIVDAEDSLAELASRELKITELDGLEFSIANGTCQGIIKSNGLRIVVPKSVMSESKIEELVLQEAPELFWMIHPESPLMNAESRRMVIQVQYFNQIIKLAQN